MAEKSRRVFAKLAVACIDESGKLADSECVALSGCLATQEGIDALRVPWAERLNADGIPFISMKEAMHFDGPFFAWRSDPRKEQRRDSLLRAKIFLTHQAGVGYASGTGVESPLYGSTI